MARYIDDYQGIVGHDVPGRGMDPNWHGAYEGMRMRPGRGQAAYGRYRQTHAREMEGEGGFRGRYGSPGREPRGRLAPSRNDRDWSGGGVRNIWYDRDLLHDFNANSPALRREGRYDMEQRRPTPPGLQPWGWGRRGPIGYANRGLSDAGYGEGWAWGPMRGSR